MEVYLTTSVEYNNKRYEMGYIYDFPERVAERLIEVDSAKLPDEVQLDTLNKKGVVAKSLYEFRKQKVINLLEILTVKQLRKIAQEKKIVNYADLRKDDLINQIVLDI